jgi:DNA-binding NarL/FixJ family response regulator
MTSVLVVEDEEPLRELASELLGADDRFCVVGRARDGREAIALARHHQPGVVLLDLAMPGIGGLEALPLIRAVSPGASVIILSGLDDPDVRDRARNAGAAGFLVKEGGLVDLADQLAALGTSGPTAPPREPAQ